MSRIEMICEDVNRAAAQALNCSDNGNNGFGMMAGMLYDADDGGTLGMSRMEMICEDVNYRNLCCGAGKPDGQVRI